MPKSTVPVVGYLADGIVAEAYTIRPIMSYVDNSVVFTTRSMRLYELSDFDDNVAGTAYGETILGYAGDDKIAAGGGNDCVEGGLGNDRIWGGYGNDQLMGDAGHDMLRGDAGDDVLDGGEGYDAMHGGSGNDLYFVDSVRDSVNELAGEGIDTVITTLAQYTLGANVENVSASAGMAQAVTYTGNELDNRIAGSAFADKLDGKAGHDTLLGGAGDDRLDGGAGNDWLDGGAGNDQMVGGGDNDTYVVDSIGDSVSEAADAGIDTVRTGLSTYSLGANVENLLGTSRAAFQGFGNALDNRMESGFGNDRLFGDAGNDFLISWSGDDLLDGGTGADLMDGGSGNDTYWVDNVGDRVSEAFSYGDGQDTVITTLQDYTIDAFIEHLEFVGNGPHRGWGTSAANTMRGADGADLLVGFAGDDRLVGNGGKDELHGHEGNDVMTGGAGADRFCFDGVESGDHDVITDFVSGQDRVDLMFIGKSVIDSVEHQWMGTGAFAGNGTASVRVWSQGTSMFAGVDSNGDGTADFDIEFAGVSQLSESDFVM